MTSELKPCPFCGCKELDFEYGNTYRWLTYSCRDCYITGEVRLQTSGKGNKEKWMQEAQQRAIDQWNKRAPSKSSDLSVPSTNPSSRLSRAITQEVDYFVKQCKAESLEQSQQPLLPPTGIQPSGNSGELPQPSSNRCQLDFLVDFTAEEKAYLTEFSGRDRAQELQDYILGYAIDCALRAIDSMEERCLATLERIRPSSPF